MPTPPTRTATPTPVSNPASSRSSPFPAPAHGTPGDMTVNGEQLAQRDGARVLGADAQASTLSLAAGPQGAHFLMVEMKKQE